MSDITIKLPPMDDWMVRDVVTSVKDSINWKFQVGKTTMRKSDTEIIVSMRATPKQ